MISRAMMDDEGEVVGMGVNIVSTQTADVLGEREHENIGEGE